MEQESALKMVDPRWQTEYLKFIETGEATNDFLVYLNRDKSAQKAVGMAIDEQIAAFRGLGAELRRPEKPEMEPVAAASQKMVGAVQSLLQLPVHQRDAAVRSFSNAFASFAPKQQHAAKEVVQTVERAMDSAFQKR